LHSLRALDDVIVNAAVLKKLLPAELAAAAANGSSSAAATAAAAAATSEDLQLQVATWVQLSLLKQQLKQGHLQRKEVNSQSRQQLQAADLQQSEDLQTQPEDATGSNTAIAAAASSSSGGGGSMYGMTSHTSKSLAESPSSGSSSSAGIATNGSNSSTDSSSSSSTASSTGSSIADELPPLPLVDPAAVEAGVERALDTLHERDLHFCPEELSKAWLPLNQGLADPKQKVFTEAQTKKLTAAGFDNVLRVCSGKHAVVGCDIALLLDVT
jgi:hypothetical protein